MDESEVNFIAQTCYDIYTGLPKKGKPIDSEWTAMAAVIGYFGTRMEVLSLATGTKCIGVGFLSKTGDVLNDSHAEVIARRTFLKYLYHQMIRLHEKGDSDVFEYRGLMIVLKEGVRFGYFLSNSPCGDASIILKSLGETLEPDPEAYGDSLLTNNQHQNYEKRGKRRWSKENDNEKKRIRTIGAEMISIEPLAGSENQPYGADVYRTGAKCLATSSVQDSYLPGVQYHEVGIVRTKPGRGDPTLSVSCSDKMARWNAIGMQGALLSLLMSQPIFLDFFIVGGNCPFSKSSFDRAISTRVGMSKTRPVYQSSLPFPDMKSELRKRPSFSSVSWCVFDKNKVEVSVDGRKQGVTKKNIYKRSSRTAICKKELFLLFYEVVKHFKGKGELINKITEGLETSSLEEVAYGKVKASASEYQISWVKTKNEFFKYWTKKPEDLLNFTLSEKF